MPSNKRLAAGGAAAVLAVGAADAGRVALHDSSGASHAVEHYRPPPGPIGGAVDRGAEVSSSAGKTLNHEAADDDDVKDLMCAAFSYYDLATDDNTSFEDFAEWAGDEVNKTSRKKAQDIYEDVTALGEGDWSSLDNFYCDTT